MEVGTRMPNPDFCKDESQSSSCALANFDKEYFCICANWRERTCVVEGLAGRPWNNFISDVSTRAWTNFYKNLATKDVKVSNNAGQSKQGLANLLKCTKQLGLGFQPLNIISNYTWLRFLNKKSLLFRVFSGVGDDDFEYHFVANCLDQLCLLILVTSKILILSVFFFILLFGVFVLHKPTESLVLRNTQDWIYPSMRLVRLVSLPILKHASFLSGLYEKPCLLQNSFFTVDNVECWTCEPIYQVIDYGHKKNFALEFSDSGIPFVVRDACPLTYNIVEFMAFYSQNEALLRNEYLISNQHELTSFSDLMQNPEFVKTDGFHFMWEANSVTTARILRQYFSRPFFIPNSTEVSIQRFFFGDHWKGKSYSLPMTEFTNVVVGQLSGERYFVLIPTSDCQDKCRVVSIVLHPRDILFYNWLYWRPVSVPVPMDLRNSTPSRDLSITYISSFY